MAQTISDTNNRITDFLKWEQEGEFSRDQVTVAASQNLVVGQVVGKNSNGEIRAYDNETTTDAGGAAAVGIMITAVTTGAGETAIGTMLARDAYIITDNLVWNGVDNTAVTDGLADLAALRILPLPSA